MVGQTYLFTVLKTEQDQKTEQEVTLWESKFKIREYWYSFRTMPVSFSPSHKGVKSE